MFSIIVELLKMNIKNSIVLYDEPELHLHGELSRKFLNKLVEIGENNQFWMATHSPEIMRQAGHESVYQIYKYPQNIENQIKRVSNSEEMHEALSSVLGNLGIVTLGKKIIFLEGESEEIDKYILERFYEDDLDKIKFVSCGSVTNVLGVHEKVMDLLNVGTEELNFFYLIRDKDFMESDEIESLISKGNNRLFVWDRYHIENYLLDEEIILESLKSLLGPENPYNSKEEVVDALKDIAVQNKKFITSKWLAYRFNKQVRNFDFDVGIENIEKQLSDKCSKIVDDIANQLSENEVKKTFHEIREKIETSLEGDTEDWKKLFEGRKILKRVAGQHGLKYKSLRNTIINEFITPPEGIDLVMRKILNDNN